MPRLKDLHIRAVNRHSPAIYFSVQLGCSVSTDGVFAIELEDDMATAVQNIAREMFPGASVALHKTGGYRLHTRSLDQAKAIIHRYCTLQVDSEVAEELRIFYNVSLKAPSFVGPDGTLHPNGQGVEGGLWSNNSEPSNVSSWSARNDRVYSVGIGAAIVRVKTVRLGDQSDPVYSYEHLSPEDVATKLGHWGKFLQRFIGQPFPSARGGVEESTLKSVPYTEQNAKFFSNTLMGLCRLSENIAAFMDPHGLEARMLTASGLLSLPAPDDK